MTDSMLERGDQSVPLEALEWERFSGRVELGENEIHLWRIGVDDEASVGALGFCLSREEQERGERFRFEKDRRSHRLTHIGKRVLLGAYLGQPPESLRFGTGSWGKPHLMDGYTSPSLEFNLSHSRGVTLIGITRRSWLGIDVEAIQRIERMKPIFRRFASRVEQAELSRTARITDELALTAWWVSKEAFVKAVGRGLSLGLDQFSVGMPDRGPWSIKRLPEEWGGDDEYWLMLFGVGATHLGGLVRRGRPSRVRAYQWDPGLGRGLSEGLQGTGGSMG